MSFPFGLYFGYPAGAVWSNLIASLIAVAFVWWRVRVRMTAHHLEQLLQRARHHQDLKDHVTATALAGRSPAMSEEEFARNLAEMMPDLNCFGCGYSGPPAGHQARHAAFLAAMDAQRGGDQV
jgi:hypothetical protein